jgi:hypothetical protein
LSLSPRGADFNGFPGLPEALRGPAWERHRVARARREAVPGDPKHLDDLAVGPFHERPGFLTRVIGDLARRLWGPGLRENASGIAGVKGAAFVIDGNKNKDTKLSVQPHDIVVIEWTYPISPPFPRSAHEKSSDPGVVKAAGVRGIVNVKGPLGVGHLGATFEAEKKGTATLTFDVSHGSDDVKMTCEVEVK